MTELTLRDIRILALYSLGYRIKDIADELELSEHQIKHRVSYHILPKLRANSITLAVATAIRKGWI